MNFLEKYHFYYSKILLLRILLLRQVFLKIYILFFQIKKYATAMFRAQQEQLFNKMISYEQCTLSATNQ